MTDTPGRVRKILNWMTRHKKATATGAMALLVFSLIAACSDVGAGDRPAVSEKPAALVSAPTESTPPTPSAQEIAAKKKAEQEANAEARKKAKAEAKAKREAAAKKAAALKAKKERQAKRRAKEEREKEEREKARNVYYKNCTAVEQAGAAPILAGDPGYGKHLDRDGDGVGCEQ